MRDYNTNLDVSEESDCLQQREVGGFAKVGNKNAKF